MQRGLPYFPFAAFAFAVFGALLVLVGTSQDELAKSLQLDLTRSGMLASSMVLGIGLGVFAGGPLVDRFDRRALFVCAAGLAAAALLTVSAQMGFARALVHVLVAGLGAGLYETVLNTETIERYGARSVRVMTLLHAATTVGAIVAPLILNVFTAAGFSGDWTTVFLTVGVLHLVLLLLALGSRFSAPVCAARADPAERGRVFTPTLLALCLAAFAYIGVESAITAFSIPYAVDGLGLGAERGRGAISTFWLGLLAGRLVSAWRVARDDARAAVAAGAVSGVAVLVGVAAGFSAVELLMAIVGFSLGGVFPMLVALAGRRTPHATGSAVGVVAGIGSAGGVVVPWLTGFAGDRIGIAFAIGALSIWCAVVSVGALYAERAHARSLAGTGAVGGT